MPPTTRTRTTRSAAASAQPTPARSTKARKSKTADRKADGDRKRSLSSTTPMVPESPLWSQPSASSSNCWVEIPPMSTTLKRQYVYVESLDLEDETGPLSNQASNGKPVKQSQALVAPKRVSDSTAAKRKRSGSIASARSSQSAQLPTKDDGLEAIERERESSVIDLRSDSPDQVARPSSSTATQHSSAHHDWPAQALARDDAGSRRQNEGRRSGDELEKQNRHTKVVELRPVSELKSKGKGKSYDKTTLPKIRRRPSSHSDVEQKQKKKRRKNTEKKRRKRNQSSTDDEEHDDVSNLKSYLNVDAMAKSTGSTHKADFRKHLERLRKERQKAQRSRLQMLEDGDEDDDETNSDSDGDQSGDSEHTSLFGSSVSGSDHESGKRKRAKQPKPKRTHDPARSTARSRTPSDWSSDEIRSVSGSDGDSDSDSDSISSEGFIVGDDQVEVEEDAKIARRNDKGKSREAHDTRQMLRPNPATQGGGVLSAFGLGHTRMSLEDLCAVWIEWAVVRMLIPFGNLTSNDRERLERGRTQLRRKMRSSEESLTSSVMRRQFAWYLKEYPKVTVKLLFDDEVRKIGGLARRGCGACHRKSQACSHFVRFEGERYDQETLGRYVPPSQRERPLRPLRKSSHKSSASSSDDDDDDDDDSSDMSTEGENLAESDIDVKGRHARRFFVGGFCAQRAQVMHALHHWEWAMMQILAKHPAVRQVKQEVRERGGHGINGEEGPGPEEVERCVAQMTDRKAATGSELERLLRKLCKLITDAEQVNRLQ